MPLRACTLHASSATRARPEFADLTTIAHPRRRRCCRAHPLPFHKALAAAFRPPAQEKRTRTSSAQAGRDVGAVRAIESMSSACTNATPASVHVPDLRVDRSALAGASAHIQGFRILATGNKNPFDIRTRQRAHALSSVSARSVCTDSCKGARDTWPLPRPLRPCLDAESRAPL